MNHRVRSVLAAVLIMVVSILLPSDFQFENTDRFVKEQSSSIQMTFGESKRSNFCAECGTA